MNKYHLPGIGLRIVKSAASVGLCFFIYVLRGFSGIPFYSAIACLQCIQPYRENTKAMAAQRTVGTMIGAAAGLLVLLLQRNLLLHLPLYYLCYCCTVALGVVLSLYLAAALNKKNAAYFSCVVFLCITMVHIGDTDPFLFVFNRVTDTMIGIAAGMAVNACHLPRKRRTDTLFVTAIDDVLFRRDSKMSDYSRIDLNRMLDDGLALSFMTMRTTASYLEAAGSLNIRLPIILMDGATIYDPVKHTYLATRALSHQDAARLKQRLQDLGLEAFSTVIMEDSALIFYDRINNAAAEQVYARLHTSPYRNYLNMPVPEDLDTAYLMVIDEQKRIWDAYHTLDAEGETEQFKILCYDSDEYPGFAYIKIYRKDATKQAMLETLKELTGFQKICTFGSISGQYDKCINADNGDHLVKALRQEFEPCHFQMRFNRPDRPDSVSPTPHRSVRPRQNQTDSG